jgi:pimeloyl-ACP methyl ester carboxylesterase
MMAGVEGTVTITGGHRVGYGITGDPGGRPVFWSPGGGGSRLLALGTPEEQAEAGVRMIAVERPGLGLSDDRPGWTLLDCAADVAAVAAHLGIERYVAGGVSAGSRVALACGAVNAGVAGVGVVSGLLPPVWFPDDDLVAMAAIDLPAAERVVLEHVEHQAADVDAVVDAMGRRPPPDGPVYARPDVRAQFVATLREGYRAGPAGAARDILLSNLPWGFDLADVGPPVRWWQGTVDRLVPASLLRRALDGLAGYELTLYEGEGHAVAQTHAPEILAGLAALD